jgi:seryl-tRNA synthetase
MTDSCDRFEKVEQFVLCKPEESWEQFDQMIGNSQEFCRSSPFSFLSERG